MPSPALGPATLTAADFCLFQPCLPEEVSPPSGSVAVALFTKLSHQTALPPTRVSGFATMFLKLPGSHSGLNPSHCPFLPELPGRLGQDALRPPPAQGRSWWGWSLRPPLTPWS